MSVCVCFDACLPIKRSRVTEASGEVKDWGRRTTRSGA